MDRLAAASEFTHNTENRTLTKDELIAGAQGCDGLLSTGNDRIDGTVLDACPTLKIVSNFAVGYDNIDVAAATARRIPVTNTPDVLTEATADIAFGLIIAAARRFTEGEQLVRSGGWTGFGPLQLLGTDLHGTTLGVMGFGRIGKAVARRAQGFGMRVVYWNRTRLSGDAEKELTVEYREREALVREADFISINVASTPDTRHLINAAALASMKRTAILVNTARGPVVDEKALARALHEGVIAAAGIDVFEQEPKVEPDLLTAPNCTVLPHLGSATVQTRTRMGMIATDNLLARRSGKPPPNCVNPDVLD
jgi:glyoxylate reductase